jgi:metal-dependent amidase/aminoacylase/carboxypeptidase family protein
MDKKAELRVKSNHGGDFHQNPELGNREFKTAEKIATHLRSLGIEVQTGIAKTE